MRSGHRAVIGEAILLGRIGFSVHQHRKTVGDHPALGRAAGEQVVDERITAPAGIGSAGRAAQTAIPSGPAAQAPGRVGRAPG